MEGGLRRGGMEGGREEEEEEEAGEEVSTFLAPSAFFLRSLMSLRVVGGEVERDDGATVDNKNIKMTI
jgi:hypothetical protein